MVIRDEYLKHIRTFYDQDLIKVITGIRRSGKSVLLEQIRNEILVTGVKEEQIININFEYKKFDFIKNDDDLYSYINEKLDRKKKCYLFVDEVQKVKKWEHAINSLKAELGEKISIFITGSNSDLLSGELATLLSGRYVSFKIFPLTFKEVCLLKKKKANKYELKSDFDDYIRWGGLPQRFSFAHENQIRTYLSDVFDSIVVKDVVKRFKIKDIDLFNRILEYIVTTPSQTFSAENLSEYFYNQDERVVGKDTIYNYLEYMTKAFLIQKADRYDVRGKRILTGKYKYYLTDLGLGQIKNTNKKEQLGAYLENVVYNELISRGYDVNVGTLKDGEIDFIATKYDEKIYIQACYVLSDDVIDREFNAYNGINDNFPKYVISTDTFDMSRNGIVHKNIIDWLLEK